MFHIPAHIAITDYALNRSPNIFGNSLHCYERNGNNANILLAPVVETWDNIQGGFLDHLDQVNKDLAEKGLPALENHTGQ
jgi:homogentisate 1,2-dioxygenase